MASKQTRELVRALRRCRKAHGMSREKAAQEMGTTAGTLYRWEKELTTPTGLSCEALEKFVKKYTPTSGAVNNRTSKR